MKVLELFSGTASISAQFSKRGFITLTLDNNPIHNADITENIFNIKKLPKGVFKVIWASPPCTAFTVSTIGKNWFKDHKPKTEKAREGLRILEHTIKLIAMAKPKFWFIENPRGKMRRVIEPILRKYGLTKYKRVTVTYCQYGDKRMKPTDIWTNLIYWVPRPICRNGDICHERAPRGSNKGTQGLKNSIDRAKIPEELGAEISLYCMS